MGGADEDKYDHPTQKPIELMRRPILNHLRVASSYTTRSSAVEPLWRPRN
jgi:hypothetical protein